MADTNQTIEQRVKAAWRPIAATTLAALVLAGGIGYSASKAHDNQIKTITKQEKQCQDNILILK